MLTDWNVSYKPMLLQEVAAAASDVAAYGQLWVKNDTPNTLWFTDDAGADKQLAGKSFTGVTWVTLDRDVTVANHGGLWLSQSTPSVTNYDLLSSGDNTYLNANTGGYINLRIANSTRFSLDNTVVGVKGGATFYVYDSTNTDYGRFSHDGTDFNLICGGTTDWNITGLTAIQAGTVDADFDALTATSYGGITEANLLDKTANETVTAIWTWGANLDMGDYEIHSYALDYETVWTEPVANTVRFDVSDCGLYFVNLDDPELSGNVTIDFTGYHSTGKVHEFTVKIQQQTSIGRTVTWPTEVKWPGGTAPTMSTGADAVDIFHFMTHDGGTTVYGTFAQDFS
jgi:hypothetical protein